MADVSGKKVLILTVDRYSASFRYRIRAMIPYLQSEGWNCAVEQLPARCYIRRLFRIRQKLNEADVIVLAKYQPFFGEWILLKDLAGKIVFDFDDSIFITMPRRLKDQPRLNALKWLRFRNTCKNADMVIVGNKYLAGKAVVFNSNIEILATSLDVESYGLAEPDAVRENNVIVWVGRPENIMYLEIIRPVLSKLTEKYRGLKLRIVCSRFPEWTDVNVENVCWSEEAEISALKSAAIGVMPLADDAWTKGKCAFKLLQYMAAGLPCVASPVGANEDVIKGHNNGYCAASEGEWYSALDYLLQNADDRIRMGKAGQVYVAEHFDHRVVLNKIPALFADLCKK